MLYHYALLPDVFRPEVLEKRPSAQVILKQLLRGLCDNGLIANLHADAWAKHIHIALLPHLPQQIQSDILSCLNKLKDQNRLITCLPYGHGDPGCHEDWLDAAVDVHSRNRLHGIVLTQSLLNQYGLPHEAFMELSAALDSPQWLERPRSLIVSMSLPDYKAALIPVLQYAKTLDLIDPYMTCYEPRFFDVVEMCARLIGKDRFRPASKRITIYTGDPQRYGGESPADRLNSWQEYLKPLVKADPTLRFRVFLWQEKDRGERFHDRFIITDQCCISVPAGLDTRRGTTPWSLQDEPICRDQLSKFSDTSTAYIPLGNITVAR